MGFKYKYHVYKTGSTSGMILHDIENGKHKKIKKQHGFLYIKMKKGKQVFYLDREHNLVDASRADTFSPKEAHRIIPEIEKSLKDYEISFLATSKKIRRQAQKVAGKNPRVETPKEEEKFPKKIQDQDSELLLEPVRIWDPIWIFQDPPLPPLLGTAVSHKKYGEGTIVKFDHENNHLTVAFAEGEKIFLFPDCFENGFLVAKV